MNYEYAVEKVNYEDFASGRVLYNQKGTTSFPARLISEIFLRSTSFLQKQGKQGPYSIYDPLCGGAYGVTILGFLHNSLISRITASDIDENVIQLAARNLSLLTEEGMEERIKQISGLIEEFDKASHKEALQSVLRLRETVRNMPHKIETLCYQADALRMEQNNILTGKDDKEASQDLVKQNSDFPDTSHENNIRENSDITGRRYDIIITDVPYGELVEWVNEDGLDAAALFLENLIPKLYTHSVVAISSDKQTVISSNRFKRLGRFNLGKRQVVFLQPLL